MPRHPSPTTVSKFLAKHLRHAPESIGIELDRAGWTDVDGLLAACERIGFPMTREALDAAVHAPGKRRYAYDGTGTRIRAVQGHSVPVDLGYAPSVPPAVLFHGTHEQVAGQVPAAGLLPMGRHHVHLSPDVPTARAVGARRGRPVVLEVAAGRMHAAGHLFLLAASGVWLTHRVPPGFLRRLDRREG